MFEVVPFDQKTPYVFILDPADDSCYESKEVYTDWKNHKLIPMLDEKHVTYKTADHFPPGIKWTHIEQALNNSTYNLFPVCPALCTQTYLAAVVKTFQRKNPIVLVLPKDICETPDMNWGGLGTYTSYRCDNDEALEKTINLLSKWMNEEINNRKAVQDIDRDSLSRSVSSMSLDATNQETASRSDKSLKRQSPVTKKPVRFSTGDTLKQSQSTSTVSKPFPDDDQNQLKAPERAKSLLELLEENEDHENISTAKLTGPNSLGRYCSMVIVYFSSKYLFSCIILVFFKFKICTNLGGE